jgi:hypothetical protein
MDKNPEGTITTDADLADPDEYIISIPSNTGNITFSGTGSSQYSINTSGYPYTKTFSGTTISSNIGNITFGGTSSYSINTSGYPYTKTFQVNGNAEFDGDVKIKGIDIAKTLEEINKKLAILVPDPKKLEHFEALKKAYDHYKTLEALCQLPVKKDDE